MLSAMKQSQTDKHRMVPFIGVSARERTPGQRAEWWGQRPGVLLFSHKVPTLPEDGCWAAPGPEWAAQSCARKAGEKDLTSAREREGRKQAGREGTLSVFEFWKANLTVAMKPSGISSSQDPWSLHTTPTWPFLNSQLSFH